MNDLFLKALSFDDSEIERIEKEENKLLESLNAYKLHELDNIAFDGVGNMYALEDIEAFGDIIKYGLLFAHSKKLVKRGEKFEL